MAFAGAPSPRRAGHAETLRVHGTTVHVVAHPLERTEVRVVRLRTPSPLEAWCARHGVAEAVVGGFFVRGGKQDYRPLGELRTRGIRRRSVPFDAPWGAIRACLASAGTEIAIARRPDLPARPRGDLLQAGPLLVSAGTPIVEDEEGFSAGAHQFDSDITRGRYPRAALAVTRDRILAVACDGRADDENGLSLPELAQALADLGAVTAINLDGGGSTSLVSQGELRNVPRESHGVVLAGGRPIPTALAFTPR
ncbi:MAG: phosphodiester glycosidase family protein [Actinomycetota bacterium]|nr:phosphodiester glycosidase family protein [Actinomycetota bacterium]